MGVRFGTDPSSCAAVFGMPGVEISWSVWTEAGSNEIEKVPENLTTDTLSPTGSTAILGRG